MFALKKQAQLQTCQTTGAQLENGRTEMHWKPWDMWLRSSNSAESVQPSSKHWEEREGARRMGPTTDGTVSGHLRGLLRERGLLEVQPQAETLLQSGALQRIQSPF